MKVTQRMVFGDGAYYLDAASIPVDRFTRLLIRDCTVTISIDTGWAVLNAKPLCHRWLLHRMQKHPIQLHYEISTGNGWQEFNVPVAVAV